MIKPITPKEMKDHKNRVPDNITHIVNQVIVDNFNNNQDQAIVTINDLLYRINEGTCIPVDECRSLYLDKIIILYRNTGWFVREENETLIFAVYPQGKYYE